MEKSDKKSKSKKEEMDVNKLWEQVHGAVANEDDDDDDDYYQMSSEYQEWHRHVPPVSVLLMLVQE